MNDEFKMLLSRLIDDCPNLSIIITSNKGTKSSNQLPSLRTMFLEQMYPISAVNLFFEQIENPKIKITDIVDMILKDKNYPI